MSEEQNYEVLIGVVGKGQAPTYFWEDVGRGNDVDGEYEEHRLNCRRCFRGEECRELDFLHEGYGNTYVGFRRAKRNEEPDLEFEGKYGKRGYVFDPDAEYSAVITESDVHILRSKWVMIAERTFAGTYPNQGNLEKPSDKPLSVQGNAINRDLGDIIGQGITGQSNIFAWTAVLLQNNRTTATLTYSLPPDLYDSEYDDIDSGRIFLLENLEEVLKGG